MIFLFISLCCVATSESNILDPALYLAPSPPLNMKIDPVWLKSLTPEMKTNIDEDKREAVEARDSMEAAETFWPRIRSSYSFPIQFHFTGTYGGSEGSGVIGNSYATISSNRIFGKPLAGSGYGSYRPMKIFSGSEGPAWSGWGNGKWGHYGKGK